MNRPHSGITKNVVRSSIATTMSLDDTVEIVLQHLDSIAQAYSISDAQDAMDRLYVSLSVEDSKLSSEARELFKSMISYDGALGVLIVALRRENHNSVFYRRCCACVSYLIRENEARTRIVIELGFVDSVLALQERFPKNVVIQWQCLSLLGMLTNHDKHYTEGVVKILVDKIIHRLIELRQSSKDMYDRGCREMLESIKRNDKIRLKLARRAKQLSKELETAAGCDDDSGTVATTLLQDDRSDCTTVCHDILLSLSEEIHL